MPGFSQNLDNIFESLHHAVRSFVKNLRARRSFDRLECRATLPAFGGKKSAEAKRIARQATRHQRRQKSRRAGNRHHRHMMPDGQRNQPVSGIGNSRHARVRDQRDARALLHLFHQFGRARHLVVLVIAGSAGRDAVMVEQFLRLPGIFAGNHVHFFEHAQCPQRDVLEIADRCGHEVQRRTGSRIVHGRKFTIAEELQISDWRL